MASSNSDNKDSALETGAKVVAVVVGGAVATTVLAPIAVAGAAAAASGLASALGSFGLPTLAGILSAGAMKA